MSRAEERVIRLTEAMSAELKEKNVNVNCVLPTIIDTPDNRAAMPDADPARWVSVDALAAVIVFLASDAARAIHGMAIPCAGSREGHQHAALRRFRCRAPFQPHAPPS